MSRKSLEFAFTEYVGSLDRWNEPELAAFEGAWKKLSRILSSQLQQRSLSTAPPCFLGIYGYESWSFPQPGALWELTQDCFTSIFVERLHLLKPLLEKLDHIEGAVFQYAGYFLHDRQRKHDLLGYRVFNMLSSAAKMQVQRGNLHLLDGAVKIKRDTVMGIAPNPRPGEAAEPSRLDETARAWADKLLPDLITARGRDLDKVRDMLGDRLLQLANDVRRFCFGDLVGPLRNEVRARWHMAWRFDQGEITVESSHEQWAQIVRWIRPDPGFEQRVAYEQLTLCVTERIPKISKIQQRTLEHLDRLWIFIRSWMAEADEDQLPAYRRLEELLQVPRKKIPDLLELLRGLLGECRHGEET